jgi:peptidoglycan/xylan/chitin deacetylase (PgdA/CDA1 family)
MRKIVYGIMMLMMISCGSSSSSSSSSSKSEGASKPQDTPAMYVALSFDDGPNNTTTPKMLDVLEAFDAPASFFVIGQNINDSTAGQMKRAVKLGCEIQNHSYTHSFMSQMTAEDVQSEIERTDALIEKYIGIRPWLFRPPYIDHNEAMHKAVGHTFICGLGCEDWVPERTAQMRHDAIMANVKNGDIILLHDFEGNDSTVEALRTLIPALRERGFTLVTVSDLFEKMGIKPEANSGIIYTNATQTK